MRKRGGEDTACRDPTALMPLVELTGIALRASSCLRPRRRPLAGLPATDPLTAAAAAGVSGGGPGRWAGLLRLDDVAGAVTGAGPGALAGSQIGVSAFSDPDADGLLISTDTLLPLKPSPGSRVTPT